jgi:hypothetical protein
MSLTIELPNPIDEGLTQEARRKGVSAEEHATLLVVLTMAFLKEQAPTPFQEAVKGFLAQRALDADQIASAFEELVRLCVHADHGEGKASSPLQEALTHAIAHRDGALLRQWRNAAVHRVDLGGSAESARELSAEPLLPTQEVQPAKDDENAASIALLQSWLEEDATDDPEEIRKAQEELDEFKRAINAERERAGARRIYP